MILLCSMTFLFSVNVYAQFNDTIHKKVYKVGQPNIQGLMYVDNSGYHKGFPFEIVLHLAQDENIEIEWEPGTWPQLYKKLVDGDIDILPGTQVTLARKREIDFLKTNLFTMWSELYLSSDAQFENLYDLEGKKIALVDEDNNAAGFVEYINDFKIDYIPVSYPSHEAAVQGLKQGEVYAMVGPTSKVFNKLFKGLRNAKLYFNPTDLNIAFAKNKDKELQRKLNYRLEVYKSNPNSIYYELIRKYSLANYRIDTYVFPLWGKLVLIAGLFLVIVSFSFIYILRKRVELKTRELIKRKEFLKQVLKISEMGGWSLNLNKGEIFWSDELYFLHGLNSANPISVEEMKNLIHPDDREKVLELMDYHIKNRKDFSLEYRVIVASGEIINTRQIGVFEVNEKEKINLLIGITQNITKENLFKQELIEAKNTAEANDKLKTLFINNMSHEIRTPMNGILGFTSMLEKTGLSDEKRKNYIAIIKKSGAKLLRIIDDIMEISILGTKQIELKETKVGLNQLFDELQSIFQIKASSKGLRVNFTKIYSDQDCSLLTDESKLNKILSNIIENSLKYTESGSVDLRFVIENMNVKIYIEDTGIGISKNQQERIFERFYQVQKDSKLNEGLGLGLAIAKENAELLGGDIFLSSEEGKGSIFSLTIPFNRIEDQAEEQIQGNIIESQSIKKNARVLIAEDEPTNTLYLETILNEQSDYCFEIIKVENGKEAVQECLQRDGIELVFMDLKMPELDGFIATQKIKDHNPKISIIAQTAYSSSAERERAKAAGCDEFLSKPIEEETVIKVIRKYL